jgi:obg-like ATPase 1
LEDGLDIRQGEWDRHEVELLNSILFLTAKPVIFLVNLSEKDYILKKNKWLSKIKAWVDEHEHNGLIIPYSADFEYSLALLPDDEARAKRCEEAGAPSYAYLLGRQSWFVHEVVRVGCCPRSLQWDTRLSTSATTSLRAR